MLLSALFSLSADLCLVDVRLEDEGVTLVLRSSQTTATCPACAKPSTRVHGHYTRRLADLPCQKRPVRVCLEVRRFACRTRGCPRTTFAERFPTLTHACARRTLRLAESLTEIAFARGEAKPGQSWRSASGCRPVAILCYGSSAALRSPSARPRACWAWTTLPGKKATVMAPCWSI